MRTVFSDNAEFFAIISLNPLKSIERIDRELTISVYDQKLQSLYRLKRTLYYDRSLPLAELSAIDGSLVLGENDTGDLYFYNHTGQLLRQVSLFPDADYDLEKVLYADFSADGGNMAVVAAKRGNSPRGSSAPNSDSESHIFLFNTDGEEQWRKRLPEQSTSGVVISPDGQYMAAACYTIAMDGILTQKTVIFDNRGSQQGETDLMFKRARFSPHSDLLILADNQHVRLVNIPAATVMWNKTYPRQEGMITALDVTSGGYRSVLLTAQNDWTGNFFIFRKPSLIIVDKSGNIVHTQSFLDREFIEPALLLSEDSGEVSIGFENALQIFRMP
ncbi:MAG: hypothetical protein EH225_10360 [Calditrichaeota bacterium]|nr:MAG: hypothetical protein EH225_10360 [Calditrichota bacterium]